MTTIVAAYDNVENKIYMACDRQATYNTRIEDYDEKIVEFNSVGKIGRVVLGMAGALDMTQSISELLRIWFKDKEEQDSLETLTSREIVEQLRQICNQLNNEISKETSSEASTVSLIVILPDVDNTIHALNGQPLARITSTNMLAIGSGTDFVHGAWAVMREAPSVKITKVMQVAGKLDAYTSSIYKIKAYKVLTNRK